MDSSAEPGASIGTSKLLWTENGPFTPNSGPICGLRQRNSCCSKSLAPSTSAFADIKRMIDEPEWEAFHKDLSSSDFERIRVATQEPEAFLDFLACGSGTKNGGKRKQRENSLPAHPDSSSSQHKSKRVKTETEQSRDRDSEILALTHIGLNVRNCFVKIERQDPELSSVLECPVPTLDTENQSRVDLNENCGRGIIESVQDSVVKHRVSSIVSEKLPIKKESEPLVECPVRVDDALASSSEETKCTLMESMENGSVPSSIIQQQSVTDDSITRAAVPLSNVQIKFLKVDSCPEDSFPSTSSDQDGTRTDGLVAMDPIPASNPENVLGAENPLAKSIAEACSNVQNSIVGCDPSADVSFPSSNIQQNLVLVIPMMPVQVQIGSNPMVEGVIIPKVACATPNLNPRMNKLSSNVSSTKVPPQILSLLVTNPVGEDPDSASKQGESAIAKCSVLNDPATLIPALNTESFELTTGTEVRKRSVSASGSEQEKIVEIRTSRTNLLPKITPRNLPAADVPVSDSVGGENKLEALPVQKTPNEPMGLAKPKTLLKKSILSYESDKCTDVRSNVSCKKHFKVRKSILSYESDKCTDVSCTCSRPEKVSEEKVKVVNVKVKKSKPLKTDEQLLKEIVDTMKSKLVFKPFCATELETLAPEVVKHWKTKGLSRCRVKSAISSYVTQEPKYLQMLKTYVHDGIDEDAIRSLPLVFQHGSERFHLRIKCPVCCKILTKRLFQHHMNNHANRRPYKCEKCGRGYPSEKILNTHKRVSKCSGTPFQCRVCGKPYECRSGLRIHEKTHDPNRKMYKCHVCDATFAISWHLNDHLARHTNAEDPSQLANPFQCHVCGKQYASKRKVTSHNAFVHLKNGWKPRECKKCNIKFESRYQYVKHVLIHKGTEKPHKCSHCDKRFTLKRLLKSHVMIHTGEKPHKCDVCGHAFVQKSALYKHRFTHQGRKPYCCEKCGMDSRRKQDIIEHKCPMDKSSKVTEEGDQNPVPAPVLNKATKLSSTKKKVFRRKSILSCKSDESKDVRRSSRSKSEKVCYKEQSDDDESSPNVPSEDGDSSDEDFKPDDQLSDDEVEDSEIGNDEVEDDKVDEVDIEQMTPLSESSDFES